MENIFICMQGLVVLTKFGFTQTREKCNNLRLSLEESKR